MKGKKRRRHHGHYSSAPSDRTAEESAARLAPAEEHDRKAAAGTHNNGGAIVVDAGGLLPEGFGAKRKSTRLFEDRVVIVIVALVLTFTAFVAWRVSQMRDEPQPVQIVQPEASKQ